MRTRYRGRHRAPSSTAAAALTARAGALFALSGTAIVALAPLAHAEVDWDPIIACESGGNPTAQNPTSSASGLFQFIDSTWASLGGSTAHAKDAPVAEQYAIANRQYAISGFTAWNASRSCWSGKLTTSTPTQAPRTSWAAASAEPAVSDGQPYVVRRGDTLSGIAAAHGRTSWRAVYEANRDVIGGDPDLILPGQQLAL